MRYKFLLDLNVIYDAVRGVDRYDKPSIAALELLLRMARICHSITIHKTLRDEYYARLKRLEGVRLPALEPAAFIKMFFNNSLKRNFEYEDLPELPAGVTIPKEDEQLVRAALISHPIVITEDGDLLVAINNQPSLNLRAFTIEEGLDFIKRECEAQD